MSSILNIAELCPATRALGPGLRSALWVQGCPIGCPGCISADWIPNIPAHRLTPAEAAARLLSNPAIEGITLSGGEPMAQAAGLAEMLQIVRATRPDLHVICFSGYTYEALLRQPASSGVPDLLSRIDLLIDGPYVQALNQGDTFAGSRNQRLIPLSQRPLPGDARWELRKLEMHIRDGAILTVGVPPKDWEPLHVIS
jgi:anaerobic ribonucleoside-triphosphate reductase activating protein